MKLTTSWIALTVVACFGMLGCQEPADSTTGDPPPVSDLPPATVDDHAGHAHPTEGPHGGDLIELGNEEYHAELIHPHDHDDVVFRCPRPMHLDLPSHRVASGWESWLQRTGFRTEHKH